MLKLTPEHYDQIVAHGLSGKPLEICGLLVGTHSGDETRVLEVHPVDSEDKSELTYTMNPLQQMKIERDEDAGTISLDCRTASYDVRSNPASLRMNNSQHQARHPGERGFEYLTSLIGNPAVWVSKSLQGRLNEIARKKG